MDLTKNPPFLPTLTLSITNWSMRSSSAMFCKSLSKTIVSKKPVGSSIINLVKFLSELRVETRPYTYMSFFNFAESTNETGFAILASGRFETICLSFENLLANKELNPSIPSADVIFEEGSDKILDSHFKSWISFIPKKVSKSFLLIKKRF